MERESFIFYASFYDAIKELPEANQLKIYQAVVKFAITGEETEGLTGIDKAVFLLIKPQILANNERYENGCKGAEFGKLGGRPKKKTETPKNPIGVINKNPKETPNENENENDNVNENVIEKKSVEKKTNVALSKATPPHQEVYNYFAQKYKDNTGIAYKPDKKDFVLLAKLCKDVDIGVVKQKIDWLEVGCTHDDVYWFAKDINDFTIGTLTRNWNSILPRLTDEQKEKRKEFIKDQEMKKRVMADIERRQRLRLAGGTANV